MINQSNLLETYRGVDLVDLPGINVRFKARLNANGIFTPLQFFDDDMLHLKKQVFKSIGGYYWYLRLRGWEIDDVDFGRKSFGHTYALGKKTSDREELSRLLMKLCVKVGSRLRESNFYAEGISLYLSYKGGSHWRKGCKVRGRIYTDQEIFRHALRLLDSQPETKVVTNLAVTVYSLRHYRPEQTSIFDGSKQDSYALMRAIDDINERYGNFAITPASMMDMDNKIVDRVAFWRG